MNIGLIGLDTSHVSHFTRSLNTPAPHEDPLKGRIVAAYPGGSPRLPHSFGHVAKYSEELTSTYGVKLVDSIEALHERCDAFFITSIDAAQHQEQLEAVAITGKPVFIDKPFAHSLADAQEMMELAGRYNAPLFSSSALRYAAAFRKALAQAREAGPLIGCDLYGPMMMPEGGNGYFWYGIHTAEMLFSAMGDGYESVSVTHTRDFDLLGARWSGGRIGTIRGTRVPHYLFGGTLHTPKGTIPFVLPEDTSFYGDLLQQVMAFLHTGICPVPPEETLGVIAMLEEAQAIHAGQEEPAVEALKGS